MIGIQQAHMQQSKSLYLSKPLLSYLLGINDAISQDG